MRLAVIVAGNENRLKPLANRPLESAWLPDDLNVSFAVRRLLRSRRRCRGQGLPTDHRRARERVWQSRRSCSAGRALFLSVVPAERAQILHTTRRRPPERTQPALQVQPIETGNLTPNVDGPRTAVHVTDRAQILHPTDAVQRKA